MCCSVITATNACMVLALWLEVTPKKLLSIVPVVAEPSTHRSACPLSTSFPSCYLESPDDAVWKYGEWMSVHRTDLEHKRQGKVGHLWIVFSLFHPVYKAYLYSLPQTEQSAVAGVVMNHLAVAVLLSLPHFPFSFSLAPLKFHYTVDVVELLVIYWCSEHKLKQCLNKVSILSIFTLCMLMSISLFLFNLDFKIDYFH